MQAKFKNDLRALIDKNSLLVDRSIGDFALCVKGEEDDVLA